MRPTILLALEQIVGGPREVGSGGDPKVLERVDKLEWRVIKNLKGKEGGSEVGRFVSDDHIFAFLQIDGKEAGDDS